MNWEEYYANLTPSEYCGIVMKLPKEDIPVRMAEAILRTGRFELARYQHFINHDHPYGYGDPEWESMGIRLAEILGCRLAECFPGKQFVVEEYFAEVLTWYQRADYIPTEDEEEWDDYYAWKFLNPPPENAATSVPMIPQFESLPNSEKARSGGVGRCEYCRSDRGFSEPVVSLLHRGMRYCSCLACRERLLHSTRLIRIKVGF